MTERELCAIAIDAARAAYAPYSGYQVGAALLTESGQVFTGCNIENASFTPTVCAERTAFFKAISEGQRRFRMIAVAGGKQGKISGVFPPCGVCRQVMAEFCTEDFLILAVKSKDEYERYTLRELLPHGFSAKNITLTGESQDDNL